MFSTFLTFASVSSMAATPPSDCHELYPHWCSSSGQAMPQQLQNIEKFLITHQPQDGPVAFDWDGTLYNEEIPVEVNGVEQNFAGQPAWFLWGAKEILHKRHRGFLTKDSKLFPSFEQFFPNGTPNFEGWADALTDQTLYLEGRYQSVSDNMEDGKQGVSLPQGVYGKFSQSSIIEAGMTLRGMQYYIGEFLKKYPTSKYEFKKMMDIVHRVNSRGYSSWIITGSNPYYVADLIYSIDANNDLGYKIFPSCYKYMQGVKDGSSNLSPDAFFAQCKIAGNGSIWPGGDQPFTNEYDARNIKIGTQSKSYCSQYAGSKKCKFAIDHFGKQLAAEHISSLESGRPIIMYAGNSDGDFSLMQNVLDSATSATTHFGIFVRPDYGDKNGDFYKLYSKSCSANSCQLIDSPDK